MISNRLPVGARPWPACEQAAVYSIVDVPVVATGKGQRTKTAPIVPLFWLEQPEGADGLHGADLATEDGASSTQAIRSRPERR
jgi:hypothetical protein